MIPIVTVAMLAYGAEPDLRRAVQAVLASQKVLVRLVLVDNGSSNPELSSLGDLPGVTLLQPGINTGFSGGCNLALADCGGDIVALVNSDAFVDPLALSEMAKALIDDQVGIVTASLRLAEDPDRMNSAGNPLTYTGLSWAGALGEPALLHRQYSRVASASGACLALRTRTWELLRGFDEAFHAYHEDTDLSLRCWQLGLSVIYVPEALVLHRYEFSRNDTKFYLVERNRLLTVLVDYQLRTLAIVAPALLLVEVGIFLAAVAGGWWREKLRGYMWLLRRQKHIRERRAWVQSVRVCSDRTIVPLMTDRILPGQISSGGPGSPPGTEVLNSILAAYWGLVRSFI